MEQNFKGFFCFFSFFFIFYNFMRNFPNIRMRSYLCPMGLGNAWIRDGIDPMPGTRIQSGIISFRYSNFSNLQDNQIKANNDQSTLILWNKIKLKLFTTKSHNSKQIHGDEPS